MATFIIPADDAQPFYRQEVELDRVVFRMRLKFNERDAAWYVSMYDLNDVLLRGSIRIVEDFPLLRLWRSQGRPAGEILALSTAGVTRPPLINELASAFDFVYVGGA